MQLSGWGDPRWLTPTTQPSCLGAQKEQPRPVLVLPPDAENIPGLKPETIEETEKRMEAEDGQKGALPGTLYAPHAFRVILSCRELLLEPIIGAFHMALLHVFLKGAGTCGSSPSSSRSEDRCALTMQAFSSGIPPRALDTWEASVEAIATPCTVPYV